MNDKFTKVILVGILICLIMIAQNPLQVTVTPAMSRTGENKVEVISLGENKIAVIDNRSTSGLEGNIVAFEYDEEALQFKYMGFINYEDYIQSPYSHGIEIGK